jgi:hypothetical protein
VDPGNRVERIKPFGGFRWIDIRRRSSGGQHQFRTLRQIVHGMHVT